MSSPYEQWKGVFSATLTAFHEDGTLNDSVDLHVRYARHLVEKEGATGVFITGTSGESLSLSKEERKKSAEAWMKAKAEVPLKVIVHVGSECLPDAQELAAHAESLGVDGIACQSPVFFLPTNAKDLVSFCSAVASAAPKTPFFYYHFPTKTNSKVLLSQFFQEGKKRIPTLAGAKFTSLDNYDLISARAVDKNLAVLASFEQQLICGLPMDCRAWVMVSANVFGPLYNEIIEAFRSGDMEKAMSLQTQSVEFFRAIEDLGFIQAHKTLMKRQGLDFGPCRVPLSTALDEDQEKELFARLSQLDPHIKSMLNLP